MVKAMVQEEEWLERAKSANSLSELRDILEHGNVAFREAAVARRSAETMTQDLRRALARTRKREKVSQDVLADTIGTTQSGISMIERGTGDIGVMTVFRYLEGLDVDPSAWLLNYAEQMKEDENRQARG